VSFDKNDKEIAEAPHLHVNGLAMPNADEKKRQNDRSYFAQR